MKSTVCAALSVLFAFAAPAAARGINPETIKKILSENPDILLDVLRSNKGKLFDIVDEAAREAQKRQQRERAETKKREFEAAFKNPFKPDILKRTHIRGNPKAEITLMEYSDFECSYCKQAFKVVEKLRERYGKRLRFIYKHKPLSFHPKAMPAALYMEAVSLQSKKKAWKFHDALFRNQDKLGNEFFRKTAEELGVNMKKLDKALKDPKLKERVRDDIVEAESFGFSGTPGFLINGIPVRGAYPESHFVMIVERLEKEAKARK